MIINTSKLRKSYTINDMSYLDSYEASVLYKTQAEIVKKHSCKHIVDVGCRTGEINKYLYHYKYNYYGFDTSHEPIEFAKKQYPDHLFELRNWNDLKFVICDIIIFGSVLIYDKNPIDMFERICNFYKPKRAIVHEVNRNNKEELPYIDINYFNQYKNVKYEFNLNIPVGHRTIIDVEL